VLAVERFDAQLATECPGVLAGAPRRIPFTANLSASETIAEINLAAQGAGEAPEHALDVRFAGAVEHLRWSNEKLTRLTHAQARQRAGESGVPPPHICSDMRYWVADGYTSISPSAAQYLRQLEAISNTATIALGTKSQQRINLFAEIPRLLARYENQADRRTVKGIHELERASEHSLLARHYEAVARATMVLDAPVVLPSTGS
jgi:hypothetical protein